MKFKSGLTRNKQILNLVSASKCLLIEKNQEKNWLFFKLIKGANVFTFCPSHPKEIRKRRLAKHTEHNKQQSVSTLTCICFLSNWKLF